MRKLRRCCCMLLAFWGGLWAQIPAAPDSLSLGYADYLGIVLENHPIAKQAALRGQSGAQYVRAARGAFDPYLAANWDAKEFAGKNYWQLFEGSLRVPTWFGTELYAGWNSANGDYLSANQYLPSSGQGAIGVEVTLGKGLIIDQRRADLAKSKLYAQSTLAEQRSMLLDLIVDASNAYWNWSLAYANKQAYLEALDIAQKVFAGVRSSYERGENPAIDTLESFIQVQTRQFNLSEADVDLIKTSRTLNNYLWSPNGEPVEFVETLKPAALPQPGQSQLPVLPMGTLDSLIAYHPDLLYYQYQQGQLEIEEKWRKEQLKPDLSIKYQALTAAAYNGELLGALNPASNLKWGVKFSMPLFLRKQRGYLALTRISIQENLLRQDQKKLELRNKIAGLINQMQGTETQLALYASMVTNYERMVSAEIEKFDLGESSIFLVNSREQKLLEAELKRNQLASKLPMLFSEANRATGGYLIGR
jgi:outer membrane protein TolC